MTWYSLTYLMIIWTLGWAIIRFVASTFKNFYYIIFCLLMKPIMTIWFFLIKQTNIILSRRVLDLYSKIYFSWNIFWAYFLPNFLSAFIVVWSVIAHNKLVQLLICWFSILWWFLHFTFGVWNYKIRPLSNIEYVWIYSIVNSLLVYF